MAKTKAPARKTKSADAKFFWVKLTQSGTAYHGFHATQARAGRHDAASAVGQPAPTRHRFKPVRSAVRFLAVPTSWLPAHDRSLKDKAWHDAYKAIPAPAHALDIPPAAGDHLGCEYSGDDADLFLYTRDEAFETAVRENAAELAGGGHHQDYRWVVVLELGQFQCEPFVTLDMDNDGIGYMQTVATQPFRLVHPTPAEIQRFA